jgi:3-oxoacyl-[acyl-carrier-protein] synthase II
MVSTTATDDDHATHVGCNIWLWHWRLAADRNACAGELGGTRISPFFVTPSSTLMPDAYVVKFGFNFNMLYRDMHDRLRTIGLSARLSQRRHGAMIAGGAEATVSALGVGGLRQASALSTAPWPG